MAVQNTSILLPTVDKIHTTEESQVLNYVLIVLVNVLMRKAGRSLGSKGYSCYPLIQCLN